MKSDDKNSAAEFARQAELPPASFAAEVWDFIKNNKKWWLTPIIVAIVFLFVLIALANTGAAPFIYTLF